MPWTILEKLWQCAQEPQNSSQTDAVTFDKEIEALYKRGISMETTLRYLYFEKPDFNAFKTWIESKTKQAQPSEEMINYTLSEDDLEFWNKNGYIVIKGAISAQDCLDTQNAIWDYLGVQTDDKEGWYKRHEEQRGLMLNFSDHETLNKNRHSVKIQKAYEQLYKTTALYKIIDKVSFNPPETATFNFLGSGLHWDISLKRPIPLSLQGLLYLTDCFPDDGAFHCVPGFHNTIDTWLEELAPHEDPRQKALKTLLPIPITGKAGDFIIWNGALPHCASPNHGKLPRMVQYLTYLPDNYKAAAEWI
jgi:hypothetical protein